MWLAPPTTTTVISRKQYRHSHIHLTCTHACSLRHTHSHHSDEQIIMSLACEISRHWPICQHPSRYLCSSLTTRSVENHFVSSVIAWLSHQSPANSYHQLILPANTQRCSGWIWWMHGYIMINYFVSIWIILKSSKVQIVFSGGISFNMSPMALSQHASLHLSGGGIEQLVKSIWNPAPEKVKWTLVITDNTLTLRIVCATSFSVEFLTMSFNVGWQELWVLFRCTTIQTHCLVADSPVGPQCQFYSSVLNFSKFMKNN